MILYSPPLFVVNVTSPTCENSALLLNAVTFTAEIPSCDGYASCSAPFCRTFAVEIPSTEKFTIDELAPPSAILPELSVCTFGDNPSAPSGLVVVARLFSGNCVISTRLEVTLTEPRNGKSVLRCIYDNPNGYVDMSNAHTMFGESKKKTDAGKRGRFNIGEKYVLALCDSASITSMSGRTVFKNDGTRSHDSTRTQAGTVFRGELPLTQNEYKDMVNKVKLVIPPVTTVFNGTEILKRKVLHEFSVKLPTEVADENGILRSQKRSTKIRLYEVPKDKAFLYEMGMPVVSID